MYVGKQNSQSEGRTNAECVTRTPTSKIWYCQGNVGPLTSHNPMGLHGPLQG
jgi:hypothetical protein